MREQLTSGWVIASILMLSLLAGCHALGPSQLKAPAPTTPVLAASSAGAAPAIQASLEAHRALSGRVEYPRRLATQATLGNAIDSATVTLLDTAGNALASGITDRNGTFRLTVNFAPVNGGLYVLESAKGLANATPGANTARLRTIVQWNGTGWLSVSNSDVSTPLVLNSLTTAVAIASALDGTNVAPAATIGKVNAVANPATLNPTPVYAGHPDTEFQSLATNIVSFLDANLDPVDSISGTAPVLSALSTDSAGVGSLLTLSGSGFIPAAGRTTVTFAGVAATVYSATSRSLVVGVPLGATSGNVVVTTSFGTSGGLAFSLATANVTINPGSFQGTWRITGVQSQWQTGSQAATLNVGGTYTMTVDGFDSFPFTVGSGGTVTATGSATGGTGTLSFETVNVSLNPGQNGQQWSVQGLNRWQFGTQTVSLIKNNGGTINVNGLSTPIRFSIDSAGTVSTPPGFGTGGTGTLTLNAGNVAFNMGGFKGSWTLNGIGTNSGDLTLALVRGGSYTLTMAGAQKPVVFFLDGSGTVTVNGNQATGGSGTLTIPTTNVTISTGGYAGSWNLRDIFSGSGDQSLTLPRNQTFAIDLGTGGTTFTPFSLDGSGNVVISSSSAVGGAATLTFQTQTIQVNTGGYTGSWMVSGLMGAWVANNQSFIAMKGGGPYWMYVNQNGEGFNFDVQANGTVVSRTPAMAAGGAGTITFQTVAVTINPNGYASSWLAYDGGGWRSGTLTTPTVKGTRTLMTIWYSNSFYYMLGLDGVLRLQDTPMATVSGSTITFSTVALTINANGYPGSWHLSIGDGWTGGTRTYYAVRGGWYYIGLYNGYFYFNVNPDGTVAMDGSQSATGGAGTLTFNVASVYINTGHPNWYIDGYDGWRSGARWATLVKGFNNYRVLTNVSGTQTFFGVRPNGTPTPTSFTLDGYGFTLSN